MNPKDPKDTNERTSEEIQKDIEASDRLSRSIFEITSILDPDPKRISAALAMAFGMSCGAFNYNPDDLQAVIKMYFEKAKDFYDKFYGKNDKDLVVDKVTDVAPPSPDKKTVLN